MASQLHRRARYPGEAGANPALTRNREPLRGKSEHLAGASA